jgi:hypothetical protein
LPCVAVRVMLARAENLPEGQMRFLPQFDPPSLHWSVLMILDGFALFEDGVEAFGRPIL